MCDIDGKCKCKNTNGKMMGSTASLTNIAFQTGVMLERNRIIQLIKDNSWHMCKDQEGLLTDFVESKDMIELISKGQATNESH